MRFQQYLENMANDSDEAIREINKTINKTIDNTKRHNGCGINDLKLDIINEEKAEEGTQINFEVKGSANARDKTHIISMLKKLMGDMREPLWKDKIFLEIMYHKIDLDEKHKYQPHDPGDLLNFSTIGAAIMFS